MFGCLWFFSGVVGLLRVAVLLMVLFCKGVHCILLCLGCGFMFDSLCMIVLLVVCWCGCILLLLVLLVLCLCWFRCYSWGAMSCCLLFSLCCC